MSRDGRKVYIRALDESLMLKTMNVRLRKKILLFSQMEVSER